MANTQDAFQSLAPIDWSSIEHDDLKSFMSSTFSEAQCLVDSIPVSLASKGRPQPAGRARSSTDPSAPKIPSRAPNSSARAEQLRKGWKEVQVNARDNPLGVDVYKLAAKDKKGAWFARRSVHEGLTFEKWKLGMEREFAESLRVQGDPGAGKIRGIGAEKRVVNNIVDGVGKMEVYQLSAQFPAITARDFITLLLSTDSALEAPMQDGLGSTKYFMVVSKPCVHPECPQRNGFIRGQYESVEFIREIKVEKPLRKVRSSIDLGGEEKAAARKNTAENLSKEAALRSAHRSAAISSASSDFGDQDGRKRGRTIAFAGNEGDDEDDNCDTMVEWLMVTRSDPGGSVPRFMVEKGTPAGIAGDANKFLKWITSKKVDGFNEDDAVDTKLKQDAAQAQAIGSERQLSTADPTSNIIDDPSAVPRQIPEEEQEIAPSGFYGMIAGALGVASSAVASRLPNPFGSAKGGDTDSELTSDLTEDDTSSTHSFHSFVSDHQEENLDKIESEEPVTTPANAEAQSTHSSETKSVAPSQHEKELRKLEDRRRKAHEKIQRAQERAMSKKDQDAQRDEDAIARLKGKHDREVAKQEEKYRRELKRLEDKRAHEKKKAEDRKKKQMEREARSNLSMELRKVRAERDLAHKQIDILKEQVGDLQAQNTKLVTKLGRQSTPDVLAELRRQGDLQKDGTGRDTLAEVSQS